MHVHITLAHCHVVRYLPINVGLRSKFRGSDIQCIRLWSSILKMRFSLMSDKLSVILTALRSRGHCCETTNHAP